MNADEIRRAVQSGGGLPPEIQALIPLGRGAGPGMQPALKIEFHPQAGFGLAGSEGLPPGVEIQGVEPEDVTTLFFETTDIDGRTVKHIIWLDTRGRRALLEMTAQRLDTEALTELIGDLTAYRDELAAAVEAEANGGGEEKSKIAVPGE